MELSHDFRVPVSIDRAWAVLTDLERIAPCMPGAELQEVEGDEYRGVVKVKVGPITAQYKGAARLVRQDRGAGVAVVRAEGRETRGQGQASATITATLAEDGNGGTTVQVVTDLSVTGKVAQFGRGVLADVSAKLLGQFVACLESDVLAPGEDVGPTDAAIDADGQGARSADGEGPRGAITQSAAGPALRVDSPVAEPVDLVGAAGVPVLKRVAPVLAALAFLAVWLVRRHRRA